MKRLQAVQPLLLFPQGMIGLPELIHQRAAEQAHHEKRQPVDAKSLQRLRRAQPRPRQPSPDFSETVKLNVDQHPRKE